MRDLQRNCFLRIPSLKKRIALRFVKAALFVSLFFLAFDGFVWSSRKISKEFDLGINNGDNDRQFTISPGNDDDDDDQSEQDWGGDHDLGFFHGARTNVHIDDEEEQDFEKRPDEREKEDVMKKDEKPYFALKESIVPLNADKGFCVGAPGAWFPREHLSTRLKEAKKVWDDETKFCTSSLSIEGRRRRRRRTLLGFSEEQCDVTCRSLKRDHPELLVDPRRKMARQDLVACLTTDGGCRSAFDDDGKKRWEAVAKFAIELPSVQMLMNYKPKCFTVTKERKCSYVKGNKETPNGADIQYLDFLRPVQDVKYRALGTCAMVGNSPHIYTDGLTDENALSIDKHDAVWRFNLRSGLANETNVHKKFGITKPLGKKTHYRMFNSIRGRQLSRERNVDERIIASKRRVKEEWWFWYSTSTSYFQKLKRKFPRVTTRVLNPSSVNYIVDCYMQMRNDLIELGALNDSGKNKCPTSLSSGIHLAFISHHICANAIDMFGVSYHAKQAMKAGYQGHAWAIDVRMFRLMHLVGLINVCSTDKNLE